MVYLDYNATTPLSAAALKAMRPYLEEHFGNPSSIHQSGRHARAAVDDARDRIAHLIGAKSHEIIFTGGGTESDNLAVIGLARSQASKGKHVLTTTTEHHAVMHAFKYLEKREGFEVTWLPVDRIGRIDPDQLAVMLRADTTLVSIMSANNETGTLQPLEEVARICRKRGVLIHSDLIQSFGKIPTPPEPLDALSLAAHKFHGPKGVGVLFLGSGISIENLQFGGAHENQRRPGTENVAGIVGMAIAAEEALMDFQEEQARQGQLRDRLWAGIQRAEPLAILNGHVQCRLSNTLNVSFPGYDGESLLINLDLAGICASSGSACMVGSIQASHVLLAMGVAPELARATVRFSLGKQTTLLEIESAIAALPSIFARLRPD